MSRLQFRVYKELDLGDVKAHLLVYGDLTGACASCQAVDVKLEANLCPSCGTEFKYIAFRNIKNHFPKIQKLSAQRPSLTIIDYDDYHRHVGAQKAKDFLK